MGLVDIKQPIFTLQFINFIYKAIVMSAKQIQAVKIDIGKSLNQFYNEEPILA